MRPAFLAGLLSGAGGGTATQQIIAAAFARGNKGVFPSTDPATGWWQDSAGTTPAALEQPVGRITDLSGNGYHLTQATSGNRPTWTRRVNLLQQTRFTGAVTGTPGTAPTAWPFLLSGGALTVGSADADGNVTLEFAATANRHVISQQFTAAASSTYRCSVRVVATSGVQIQQVINFTSIPAGATVTYQIDDVAVAATAATVAGSTATAVMAVSTTAGTPEFRIGIGAGAAQTGSVSVRKPDVRLSAYSAMNIPAYQRVGDGTAGVADYDTVGFPDMLALDGTSDWMATSAIDFTGTNQLEALVNVLKLSDAAAQIVYETSASVGSNTGCFYLIAPSGAAGNNIAFANKGTAQVTPSSALVAPAVAAVRARGNIATPYTGFSVNGGADSFSATSLGAGNYGNHALYFGARAGTTIFFSGRALPGPVFDTTGIDPGLLTAAAAEHAALWKVTT